MLAWKRFMKWRARQTTCQDICVIALDLKGVALVYAPDKKNKPFFYEYSICQNAAQRQAIIAGFVSQYALKNVPCAFVLAPEDYRLLFIDAPQVPAEEVAQATRWALQDLIEFPIEEAAIDIFYVPNEGDGQDKKIYAVVSKLAYLKELATLAEISNLRLQCIDIPELAVRNLIENTPDKKNGIAVLSILPYQTKLMIYRNDIFYYTREFENKPFESVTNDTIITLDHETESQINISYLLKELKRSFDFFSSRFNVGLPTTMLIHSYYGSEFQLIDIFKKEFNFAINAIGTLSIPLKIDNMNADVKNKCLTALGEVLRAKS